jgi:hypothetical protein
LKQRRRRQITKRFDVYHQITVDKTIKKDLTPFDFLVQFKPIEPSFETIINKWYSSQVALETCYIPFFNNYYGRQLYTSDKFLNMCRALEAFHRDTVGVTDPATGREYHYKKRIIEVFDTVSSCFNFLLKIRDKNKFADKIKNYRNDFTHSNPILLGRNKKYLETHYLTEKLTIIMTCAILHYQGLTKKEIKQRMTDTSLYTHIKVQNEIMLTKGKTAYITAVWQKLRFSAPQTHLWLIKVWLSASSFVVKIVTFAKSQTVISHFKVTKNKRFDLNIL